MDSTVVVFGVFEWSVEKSNQNIAKHHVDFFEASEVFHDVDRIVATDEAHSISEPRYFCIGLVNNRVMTVRFTYRQKIIRIIGAGYWRKGRKFYEKKQK